MKKVLAFVTLAIAIMSCEKNKNEKLTYRVNETASKVEWKGAAPTHSHAGSFKVSGTLYANKKGLVTGGEFLIPISSLDNYDLTDTIKPQLLHHLLSPDFFNVILHPYAKFKISSIISYPEPDTGLVKDPNYLITGEFKMIGNTQRITFPCKISAVGDSLFSEAAFKIDRTKWNMNAYNDPQQELYILPDVNIYLTMRSGVQK